ncbi:hypothetical protein SLT36_31185 (plasmid) [Aminobacter sp. BA135]|uniref:hypothetical protein n=1 Tax=Aminobacter sp. BA135 TaxID=537596 RepID=UPI003D7A1980
MTPQANLAFEVFFAGSRPMSGCVLQRGGGVRRESRRRCDMSAEEMVYLVVIFGALASIILQYGF